MKTKICSKCDTEKSLDSFGSNRRTKDGLQAYCKECVSSKSLKERYGITLEDYDRMLEDQGGCCKICGTDEPGGGNGRFHVDHNHSTDEVRGILCNSCNTGLGRFKDSPEVLLKAATYLLEQGHYGD